MPLIQIWYTAHRMVLAFGDVCKSHVGMFTSNLFTLSPVNARRETGHSKFDANQSLKNALVELEEGALFGGWGETLEK